MIFTASAVAARPGFQTLKQRAMRAGGWSFAGFGVQQAIRLASSLIMTRLLVPEMFGVMAVVTMVATVLLLLSDIGLGQNIIQSRRGHEPVFLDTAWVVQILRGFVVWGMALLLAGVLYAASVRGLVPANSVYAFPALPMIIAVSSLSAVIDGFQSTRMASAYRTFDQKALIQVEIAGQLAGLGVMIAAAAASRSIWSVVAGLLVASATRTALSHAWMRGHANRFRVDSRALREMLGFGKWVFVSSAVGVLAANGDRLILSGLVDAHLMGLYAIASLVIGALEFGVYRLFVSVSLPALSEVARTEPSRFAEVYHRLRVPADLVLLFLAGLLFAAGHQVVHALYDARYAGAGGMLQVLALSLIAVRYGIAQQAYLALGVPRYLAFINVARIVSLFAFVPALYYLAGLHGALWAIALHGLATVPLVYRFNYRLGLVDLRRELIVLLALPAGYVCGMPLNVIRG